jgi:hypothetical protein
MLLARYAVDMMSMGPFIFEMQNIETGVVLA